MLENTWACYIGAKINGFMGLLLTSVKQTAKFDVELRHAAFTY